MEHLSENLAASFVGQMSLGMSVTAGPGGSEVLPYNGDENNPDDCLNSIKLWSIDKIDDSFFFILTNNVIGASFKDGSLMLHDPEMRYFRHIVQNQPDTIFTSSKCPKILKKKIKILKKNQPDFEKLSSPRENQQSTLDQGLKENNIYTIYPVAWVQLKHITIFRFNNSAVEGLFIDKTFILLNLNGKEKKVLYWDNQQCVYCFETTVLKDSKQAGTVPHETMNQIQMKLKYLLKHLRSLK